jgi:hypothetical protein
MGGTVVRRSDTGNDAKSGPAYSQLAPYDGHPCRAEAMAA